MAKETYLGANVEITTDSFAGWIQKTNQVRDDMGRIVVTVTKLADTEPNANNAGLTVGNAAIQGVFTANTFAVSSTLRGGNVLTPANLIVSSNTIFNESALVQIGANTNNFTVNANNTLFTSNVAISNTSKVFTISTANTTITSGNLFVQTAATFTGSRVDIDGTTFDVTSNTVFTSASLNANVDVITIGFDGTDALNVNSVTDFNANVNIDGALTKINSTNTTIGDAGTDKMNVIAESIFSANATFNGALVNVTSTNTTIGNAATDRLNVNAVSDFNANVNIDGILTQTANAVFSGALVNITSANTTIGDAPTDKLNVNAVTAFANVVTIAGLTTVSNSAIVSGTLTVNTQANTASLMVRDLTATRVPYVGTAGEIIDSANLVFSGTQLSVTGSAAISGNETVGGTLGVTGAATFANTVAVTGAATFSNNAVFGDNRYIIMGDAEDLMIYHDGLHSYISDLGTGNLKLDASQLDIQTSNSTATETMATFVRDGAVTLYYDNAKKFETTAGGVSVTGTLGVSGASTLAAVSATTGTFSSTLGVSGTTTAAAINASGIVSVTNTTDATSTTAAALKTAGGLAVAKKLYIGDQTFASANVTISGVGNYITTPGANVTNNFQVGGTATINNLTVTGTTLLNTDSQLTLNNATTAHSTVTDDLTLTNATIIGSVIPDANNTYDVGSPTAIWKTLYANNVVANVAWSSVTSKPAPVVTVTLSGDVAGSGNATLTDLGNGTVNITTTVQPNSVALGTDTTGNYAGSITAGAGITVTGTAGEGTAYTIAHTDTSSVSNLVVDNSAGVVLQDLSLVFDTFGHVVSASAVSVNLDSRYSQNTFTTIAVSGQTSVVADSITDTLTLVGAGIAAITTNATTDTITITATEVDTLDSVTSRGATTTNSITVNDVNARNLILSGNLTVSGTVTTVNTETVNIADNIVVLNSNYAGSTPSENGGIEIERGTLANKSLVWDETADKWTVGSETFVAGTLEGNLNWFYIQSKPDPVITLNGDASGSVTLTDLANGTLTVTLTKDPVITLSGDVAGSATMTNLGNVTITTTVQPNSVALGTDTTGNYVADVTAGSYILKTGTAGEGWSPTVAVDATTTNTASKVVARDASGNFAAGTITAALSGNATTATTLQTARNINGVSFNGSANIEVGDLRHTTGALIIDGTAQSVPVNYLQVRAANTGQDVLVTTAGTDTNIDLLVQTKGTGSITLDTGTGAGVIDLKPGSSNVRIWDDTSTQYVQIATGDLTANRTLTLPDANVTLVSGTMVPTTGTGATGTWGISVSGNAATVTNGVYTNGDQTIAGIKTFSSTISGSINGNAATVTNGVYITGNQTIGGIKTFSSTISGSINGNAATVTNGVYTNGDQTIGGIKTFSSNTVFSANISVTGDITSTSDARLKENVVTVDSALDKVSNLRGVYYNKIGETERKLGVIAQEVEAIIPEVVNSDADGMKSVAYANMVGLLIEAIKELKAEIDELKSNK